jgi:hypothetical protein
MILSISIVCPVPTMLRHMQGRCALLRLIGIIIFMFWGNKTKPTKPTKLNETN